MLLNSYRGSENKAQSMLFLSLPPLNFLFKVKSHNKLFQPSQLLCRQTIQYVKQVTDNIISSIVKWLEHLSSLLPRIKKSLGNNSQWLCLFSLSHWIVMRIKMQLLTALYIAILILRKERTLSISKAVLYLSYLLKKK